MFEEVAFRGKEIFAKVGGVQSLSREGRSGIADALQEMQACSVLFERLSNCRLAQAQALLLCVWQCSRTYNEL